MNKTLLFVAAATVAAGAVTGVSAAKKASDPVLMTVNGKDVPVSEFVYLYEKNNQQQAAPQSLEEYVDLFTRYKLRVAAAEEAGIDTTAAFRKELAGYVNDLANPYLNDSTALRPIEDQTYDRMKENRLVSHIMLPLGRDADESMVYAVALDSIRNLILAGADFEELARANSSDRSVVHNGGSMGWTTVGKFPYPFENATFSTPVGEVSEVFEDAPYGYHIVKVMDVRPNPGKVEVEHILLLTRGLEPEAAANQKVRIDSIYTALKAGANFNEMARAFSDDPGSAAQGGLLPLFGPGQMVPEFEQVSFALADGEISEPFATSYGYHIVHKLSSRPMGSKQELLPDITKMISRDERSAAPRRAKIAQLRQQWGFNPDAKTVDALHAKLAGGMSPAMLTDLRADWTTVLGKLPDGRKVTVADAAAKVPDYSLTVPAKQAVQAVDKAIDAAFFEAAEQYAMANLEEINADFRNIVKEYRDGMLLFEVSNQHVWEKASQDKEGLEEFFARNRSNYLWEQPKYKAFVISCRTDSVADAVTALLSSENPVPDSLANVLRKNFGRNVKVERRVMARGEDPVVDFLAFNGPKPDNQGIWQAFVAYQGEMLEQPREAVDARPKVVNDYQQWLEDTWIEELRAKYPVKVNKKVLNKLIESRK